MAGKPTVDELFEMAIAAERAVEALYDALCDRFAAHAPVAAFWHSYACEEAGHARHLKRIRDNVVLDDLALPADAEMIEMARCNLSMAQKASAAEVQNLDDAYQLAHEIEHSEVNTIVELLVENYADDAHARALMRSQLREHVDRLMTGFPALFTAPAARRAVRPGGPGGRPATT